MSIVVDYIFSNKNEWENCYIAYTSGMNGNGVLYTIVFFQIISFCVSIEFALGKGVWLIPIYVLGDWIKINKLKQKPLLFLLLPLKFSVDSQKINFKKKTSAERRRADDVMIESYSALLTARSD
jgi:hypothetical protein